MKDTNNSFQFQKITIVSHVEKSGRVLKIYPKTLITTKKNTVGKSTLLNCLFWGIGCEVRFEEDWEKLDISTLIEFSINEKTFKVKRDQNHIYLLEDINEGWIKFEKITGLYLEKLNKILNFNILLNHSNAKKLSRVPPAFYFSSTYIEQMYGWNEIWNSFKNLGQFNKINKFELSKYLCGILDSEFYDNKSKQSSYKIENITTNKNIADSQYAIEYFEKYNPNISTPLQEIKKSSNDYITAEKELRKNKKDYISLSSRCSSIDNEINIVLIAIGELEQDYIFSVENIENTSVYCPTCGVEHENNLVNRFSIIHDTDKLKVNLQKLKEEKYTLEKKLLTLSQDIEGTYSTINNIFDNQHTVESLNNLWINQSFKPSIENRIINFRDDIKSNKKIINRLGVENKKIEKTNLAKVEKELNNYFNNLCIKLEIKIYEKDNLNEILNYHSGGANQIKVMLAKRLTLLNAVSKHAELYTPPFIVDSLRQQDLDDNNYEKMLRILIKETPAEVQLILAAVENDFTDAIKEDFEEINIENTLLLSSEYSMASLLIEEIDVKLKN